jgi:hypothetical protein
MVKICLYEEAFGKFYYHTTTLVGGSIAELRLFLLIIDLYMQGEHQLIVDE